MSMTISTLQQKVSGLLNENQGLDSEMRNAQENLRLSTTQNQRMSSELNEHKSRIQGNDEENTNLRAKIQKLLNENSSISQDMQSAQ